MPQIREADAGNHQCPYNGFQPCLGARCMAWQWVGPSAERATTDNLSVTPNGEFPVGVPPMPEGEGWEMDGPSYSKGYHRSKKEGLPPATAQRWVRRIGQFDGNCARHPGDHGYGGW